MTERPIRVLLVDGQVEDSRWVQDLLLDFSESLYGGGQWMAGIDVFHLQRLEDALLMMSAQSERGAELSEAIDAVLLNPALPDSFGLPSLLKMQAAAPGVPVLVLSDLDDPDLAMSMVRAGAQDFLVKNELDCTPLARALRLAIERQRTLNDLRSLSWRDGATGLYNRQGFETVAAHDLAACRHLGHSLGVVAIAVEGLEDVARHYGREERDLVLMEAGQLIRASIAPSSTAGFLGGNLFVVVHAAPSPIELRHLAERLRRRFHKLQAEVSQGALTIRFGLHLHEPDSAATPSQLVAAASMALCENIGGARPAPDPISESYSDQSFAHSAGRNL